MLAPTCSCNPAAGLIFELNSQSARLLGLLAQLLLELKRLQHTVNVKEFMVRAGVT